ncbi:uncharacterized protein LOC127240688 isoform X3 [Andrographis paniculata]|uniref:uncharacterized protein LOC127240688 isoform X3 n=1 Tax=Andrographis paniculata TaxID=175694 RepID=UPI0021E8A395|nr:uncharacterized protein LOC127240688 isoform X3 [Andrographis paniculata]
MAAAAAAEVSLISCLSHHQQQQPRRSICCMIIHKPFCSAPSFDQQPLKTTTKLQGSSRTSQGFRVSANLGGGGGGGGEEELSKKGGGKKKFITREQEPEQYWQTAGEREGENPMKTPLPYIIIFAGHEFIGPLGHKMGRH